jgi:hypothetical protein
MSAATQAAPMPPVIERLSRAMNAHDVPGMLGCLAPDYTASRPCHRSIREDREQVRAIWTDLFGHVPDFRAQLLRWAAGDESVWTEWEWSGTHADGGPFEMRGVIVYGVADGLLRWGHLYMEPVVVAQDI